MYKKQEMSLMAFGGDKTRGIKQIYIEHLEHTNHWAEF